MPKVYYRAGKPDKKVDPNGGRVGNIQPIAGYIETDETRATFKDQLTNNPDFRKSLGWTKKPVEIYLKEWEARAKTGGKFVPAPDHVNEKGIKDGLMCTNLYEVGEMIDLIGDSQTKIKTADGKEVVFDTKTETCVYDKSHDMDNIPDDVVAINGFGEASLLKVMRRRLSEKLNIYTYVGDVVLCINPYMFIPAMVNIAEYPAQINYELGSNPNAYATAHFAYWGLRDPDKYNSAHALEHGISNQSCPVSGESGAGKTVACGFIMKYLAKLSDWRMKELGEVKEEGAKDITSLVAGVSPFLEAFGNAKTTMNDNSSRFGKFTKIYVSDGKIIGAGMVKYLLEKARLVDQGEHERNYHVFYGLVMGCTGEEKAKYKIMETEKYDMLMHGHTPRIEHEIGDDGSYSYDDDRMNNVLAPDPDDTGYRAAFTAAGVDGSQQALIWDCVAAILNLGNIQYDAVGSDACKVKADCQAYSDAAQALMGVEKLDAKLVFYRLVLPGKNIDKAVTPAGAQDNTKALSKALYGHIFEWLFKGVANVVLAPKEEGAKDFVGLLDIFGFEVFKKNSIEQLCINFANEKLQKLFNDHIFNTEKETYKSQDIPLDCIPPYKDNTPCCNLVERSKKGFMGVLPYLNDIPPKDTPEENAQQDKKYCANLIKQWGREQGRNKKLKTKIEKEASEQFFAQPRRGDKWFKIVHFAGDVQYWVEGWVTKNQDKLAVQLGEMMEASTVPYIADLFKSSGGKKKGGKTIAKAFVTDLGSLAKTLESTNPHYLKCLKPNDIHFRPVDGKAAFNAWKTYRQLKFAGVMEVCKIKLQGYPFHEGFDKFWKQRCIPQSYHKFAGLEESMDSRAGCEAICNIVMPPPQVSKLDGKARATWLLGKTWLFGKDYTVNTFIKWHQSKVVTIVQALCRYYAYVPIIKAASFAKAAIVKQWKLVLKLRKIASILPEIIRGQAIVRAIDDSKKYAELRDARRADLKEKEEIYLKEKLLREMKEKNAKILQGAWRPYNQWNQWNTTSYRLGRIAIVKKASETVQKSWRSYTIYPTYVAVWKAVVHKRAMAQLDAITQAEADKVKQKLAGNIMAAKMRVSIIKLRLRVRVQKHVRSPIAQVHFRELQKLAEIQRLASFKAEALYSMTANVQETSCVKTGVIAFQAQSRMCLARKMYRRQRAIRASAHAYARMLAARKRFLAKRRAQQEIASWYRWLALRKSYLARKIALMKIEGLFLKAIMKKKLRDYIKDMDEACNKGDLETVTKLLTTDVAQSSVDAPKESRGRYWRLANCLNEKVPFWTQNTSKQLVMTHPLVNLRDPIMWSAPIHSAVKTGDMELVDFLIARGAVCDVRDGLYETPLHVTCKCGDAALKMSKRIHKSLKAMDASNETKWMLGMQALDRSDKTVLDVALNAEESIETVNWLVEEGARATTDVEDVLEKEAEEVREQELMERKIEKRQAHMEEEQRLKDPRYTFMMMDSNAGMRDPMVRQLKKRHVAKQKSAQYHHSHKLSFQSQVLMLQVFFRTYLNKKRRLKDAQEVEAQKSTRAFQIRMRHLETKRKKREAKRKASSERKYIEEKKKDEDLKKYEAQTNAKASTLSARLQKASDDRALLVKKLAAQEQEEAKEQMAQRGVRPSTAGVLLNDLLSGVVAPTRQPISPKQSLSGLPTTVPVEAKSQQEQQHTETKRTRAPAPTLRELHDQMRDALRAKQATVAKKQLERAAVCNAELEEEAARLALQIESFKKARRGAAAVQLETLTPNQVRSSRWFYQDLDGAIHGPYDSRAMHNWTMQGFFDPTLPCAVSREGPFYPLGQLFRRADQAFLQTPITVYNN